MSERALATVRKLMSRQDRTPEEDALLQILSVEIESFESNCGIDPNNELCCTFLNTLHDVWTEFRLVRNGGQQFTDRGIVDRRRRTAAEMSQLLDRS